MKAGTDMPTPKGYDPTHVPGYRGDLGSRPVQHSAATPVGASPLLYPKGQDSISGTPNQRAQAVYDFLRGRGFGPERGAYKDAFYYAILDGITAALDEDGDAIGVPHPAHPLPAGTTQQLPEGKPR
jgi:hypothetical protein